MDDLTAALRRHLQKKITDLGGPPRGGLKPGHSENFARDEERLGFAFPPLLKRIYAEIGNGGFGPGYGLTGLTGGVPDDTEKTAPALYEMFRSIDPDEPGWHWPERLLPICHWGCAIRSCIDCADPAFRMRIFDPNGHDGDDWSDTFFEEAPSFESWLWAWASGTNLWARMYGQGGHIAQILEARQPTL
jgi:hypothetical protein